MSTIHYTTAELATIAKVLTSRCHWNATDAAKALEVISLTNTIAVNIRYPNDKTKAEPSTAEAIESALSTTRVRVKNAAGTIRMLPYNCDGLLEESTTRLSAMLRVTTSILGAMMEDNKAN